MKIVVEHKINDRQKEEIRAELNQGLNDLQDQLYKNFNAWQQQSKKLVVYSLIGVGVTGFSLGYFIGKLK